MTCVEGTAKGTMTKVAYRPYGCTDSPVPISPRRQLDVTASASPLDAQLPPRFAQVQPLVCL